MSLTRPCLSVPASLFSALGPLHLPRSAWLVLLLMLPLDSLAQSPVELARGAQGIAPREYLALSLEARRRFDAGDFAAAADAYERLTSAYPHDGAKWHQLGRALYEIGRFEQAGRSFENAYRLGTLIEAAPNSAVNAALAFAKANDPERALDWLERAIRDHRHSGVEYSLSLLRDEAFSGIRSQPRFQALLTPIIGGDSISRQRGWQADLDYLLAQFEWINPQYQRPGIREQIETAAASLRERIPRLTDIEIAVELQRITALLTTSHTEVFLHRPPRRFTFPDPLPINLWVFPEGVHIVEAEGGVSGLVGSRVVAVDGVAIEAAMERIAPLVPSEGEATRLLTTRYLVLPHVLHALGIARANDRATFTVVDSAGTQRDVMLRSQPNHQWYNTLPPLSAAAGRPTPLYLSRPEDWYWFESLPDHDAVYVRITVMRNQPGETLTEFGRRLREFLHVHTELSSLIIDLRGNTGGNSSFYPELLRTLIAFDAAPGNRVVALIDRAVLSAGVNFAVDLRRLTDAIFIGEPTGGQPRQNSDPIYFQLPYSGLSVILSNVVFNLAGPYDNRRWIAPDVPVQLGTRDHFENRDPVMGTALRIIESELDWEQR